MKAKVMKLHEPVYYDYSERDLGYIAPVTVDWEEMTEEELLEVQSALPYANNQAAKKGYKYILLTYDDTTPEELFKDCAAFKKSILEHQKAEEKRKADEAAKREVKAEERKRKQLEKLKKELGE